MNILGIYGAWNWDSSHDVLDQELYCHDSGCALIVDGVLKHVITEERLTRIKYDGTFPWNSIYYVTSASNITPNDIDQVWIATTGMPCFFEAYKNKTIENWCKRVFPNASMHFVDHHLCHASSAIYTSGFDEAMFVTLDGAGSSFFVEKEGKYIVDCRSRASIGTYYKKKLKLFDSGFGTIVNNFGNWYSVRACQVLFWKFKKEGKLPLPSNNVYNEKLVENSQLSYEDWFTKQVRIIANDFIQQHRENAPGKIMGLAAYGKDRIPKISYKPNINDLLSKSYRPPIIDFDFKDTYVDDPDLCAADLQLSFESYLMEYISGLVEAELLDDNVCFSGGTFLNVLANTKVLTSKLIKNVYIPPYCSDTGMAIGAALFGAHKHYDKVVLPKNIATLGKHYSDSEILLELQKAELRYVHYTDFEKLCAFVSNYLKDNKIVGWFQNRSELGPRALGSRSILMSCSKAENKDILNDRVKHREYWRPFAGAVLKEHHSNYFVEDFDSPYMLYSYTVKPEARDIIPAINHIDNTCRTQTVTQDMYPELFTLLTEYHKITNVAVLLNTSFNDNGEPIIESPSDAIKSFINMNIDVLAIGNYVVFK